MTSHKPHGKQLNLSTVASLGVFLVFALAFIIRSGYSYGATLLLLTSLYFLAHRPKPSLSQEDKIICWILFCIFAISTLTILIHGNNTSSIDQSIRYLLAIPIFILLLHTPARVTHIWLGIAIGVILSVGIARWQLAHGYDRAEGYMNIIHFGNIALMYGVFCGAGLMWASHQSRNKQQWQIIFSIAILASIYSMIASGSRGSWSAFPALAILAGVTFLSKSNFKKAVAITIGLVLCFGVLFAIPGTKMEARYKDAISDVTNYFVHHNPDSSVGARLEMWHGALLNIPQKPIFGWNESDYAAQIKTEVSAKNLAPIALKFTNNLHNNFIQILVFEGIAGLLPLLALYFISFYFFFKRIKSENFNVKILAFCGSALLTCFFFFSMSQAILRRNDGVMMFLLTLAILWGCMRNMEQEDLRLEPPASHPQNLSS